MDFQEQLDQTLDEARQSIPRADQAALTRLRQQYLGRNGIISTWAEKLSKLPVDQRRTLGQQINQAKSELHGLISERDRAIGSDRQQVDSTWPGIAPTRGHRHPLSAFSREVMSIWRSFGFDVHEGPELEDDWYNFEGLNVPPDHPARDMQDTFYIKDHPNLVLRTHSSTVQLRFLEHRRPPLRAIEIGRIYRHEATDASHESTFMQCDGVLIDRQVTMAHLVTTMTEFFKQLLGPKTELRIRPSYFPFVEPGIEIDLKHSAGGRVEWWEMLGAGLIHPKVISAMGLSPSAWQGFAFGIGFDRLMMIKYGVPDVRLSYSNDLRFLTQF